MALNGHAHAQQQLVRTETGPIRAPGIERRRGALRGMADMNDHAVPPANADAWFAEQFTASARTMWCIALSIVGHRATAEDVVQEAAVIALGKLHEFTPGTNFNAWLARIVRFVALNHARKRHRDRAGIGDVDALDHVPGVHSTHGVAASIVNGRGELHRDQSSFDDDLTTALGTLEPIARACLLLRTVLNLPYREIAAALDLPEGTAMSHVHRSRQALRSMLCDRAHAAMRGTKDDTRRA